MQSKEKKEIAKAYLKSGRQFTKEGKLNQAIDRYQQALQLNPDLVPALARLAEIYESRKELEQAISCLKHIIQLNPDNQKIIHKLVAIYSQVITRTSNLDEAINIYKEFTQIASAKYSEKAHKDFGNILINLSTRQGKLEQAVTFFQEAIDSQSNSSPWLYYNMGFALARTKQFEKAIIFYKKAIEIKHDFWQAYIEIGKIFDLKKEKDKAFQCGMKALEINPNMPQFFYETIKIYNQSQLKTYKQIVHSFLDSSKNIKYRQYYYFGKKLGKHGECKEAAKFYQKFLFHEVKKNNPEFVNQYWENGILKEPDFLILGVMKCGTTSVYNYLSQHPQFLPAIEKEPQYFRNLLPKIKNIEQEGEWSLLNSEKNLYLAHFPPRPQDSRYITGEASITNSLPGVDKIVYNWFPNIKLIAILRNPVKRTISHYNHILKGSKIQLKKSLEKAIISEISEFEAAIESEKVSDLLRHRQQGIIRFGLYFYILERWMKLFPREQFLILTNEDLADNPAGVMKQVFDFLGLPECNAINYTPQNVGSYPKDIDPDLLTRLKDFYRPYNQRLEEFLGRKFNWD